MITCPVCTTAPHLPTWDGEGRVCRCGDLMVAHNVWAFTKELVVIADVLTSLLSSAIVPEPEREATVSRVIEAESEKRERWSWADALADVNCWLRCPYCRSAPFDFVYDLFCDCRRLIVSPPTTVDRLDLSEVWPPDPLPSDAAGDRLERLPAAFHYQPVPRGTSRGPGTISVDERGATYTALCDGVSRTYDLDAERREK